MDTSVLALLPDDALLAVLAYLPPREVLGCRVVCRRLRDLCLHPDLWRSVRLHDGVRLKCAALLFAPCLREVSLESRCLKALLPVLAEVQCVVARVRLFVPDQGNRAVSAAADVLEKLSALGGLKYLALTTANDRVWDLAPLLRVVHTAVNLRVLHIEEGRGVQMPSAASWADLDATPSLIKLDFVSSATDLSLLLTLLRSHAATLEQVSVTNLSNELPAEPLGNLPRLRSLVCSPKLIPANPEFVLRLDALHLVGGSRDVLPTALLDVIGRAQHLRSVQLPVPRASPRAPLLALARSRSAYVLERLSFRGVLDLEQMAVLLPRFPSLRSLSLGAEASDHFLRAVSPATAPSLTMLRVLLRAGACLHEWLHRPAVTELLLRHRRLHLQPRQYFRASCECQWCRRGCHAELKRLAGLQSAFAMHERMPDCPSGCIRLDLDP